jgi:hypothetical protein
VYHISRYYRIPYYTLAFEYEQAKVYAGAILDFRVKVPKFLELMFVIEGCSFASLSTMLHHQQFEATKEVFAQLLLKFEGELLLSPRATQSHTRY